MHFRHTMMSGVLALMLASSATGAGAQAVRVDNPNFGDRAINQINADGFRRCRNLGNSGYTAVVRGINEGGSGPGATGFRVHTCFKTRAGCEDFIGNIGRYVGSINRLLSRTCRARG